MPEDLFQVIVTNEIVPNGVGQINAGKHLEAGNLPPGKGAGKQGAVGIHANKQVVPGGNRAFQGLRWTVAHGIDRVPVAVFFAVDKFIDQIGRASCRERMLMPV